MTQPQPDPVASNPADGTDDSAAIASALARLAEQITALHTLMNYRVDAEHELTGARFVTFDALLNAERTRVALALDATEKAIGKAEVATAKAIDKEAEANTDRFKAVNEFRGQLTDQARSFMPRTEAVQLSDQATLRIRELADAIPKLASRQEVQLMTDRYSERITELNDRLVRLEGRSQGVKENKAGLYATLAAVGTVITIVIIVANFLSSR